MTDAGDLLGKVTFEAATLRDLPIEAMRRSLARHGLVRVRGLFDPDAVDRARRRMAALFDPARDRKHDPRDTEAVRSNLQKIVVGSGHSPEVQRELARFVRIFYNPIFCEDAWGMRELLVRLARFRNLLGGRHPDFAVQGVEDGFWTAARIHQYPRGGGFMAAHRDFFSVANAARSGADYNQPVLLLSRPGEHFREGGAFLVREDRRLVYEPLCEQGDVVAYDGRSVHGVADVDPREPIDLATFSGRVVAMASLYRVLPPGAGAYAALEREARAVRDGSPADG